MALQEMPWPVPGRLGVRPADLVEAGQATNELKHWLAVDELEEFENPEPRRRRGDVSRKRRKERVEKLILGSRSLLDPGHDLRTFATVHRRDAVGTELMHRWSVIVGKAPRQFMQVVEDGARGLVSQEVTNLHPPRPGVFGRELCEIER